MQIKFASQVKKTLTHKNLLGAPDGPKGKNNIICLVERSFTTDICSMLRVNVNLIGLHNTLSFDLGRLFQFVGMESCSHIVSYFFFY